MENVELLPEEVQTTTQELINKAQSRILELKSELTKLEYLTSKEVDGEDMSQYGNWKEYRKSLRAEVREQEAEVIRLDALLIKEAERFNTGDI